MTTSLAAVFIPILFMSGILGRLFREFAVTITTAILISGVVSVTLTPMLCSRFLRVVHSKTRLRRPDGPRVRRAAATATSGASRLVLRHRARDAGGVRRRARRHRAHVSASSRPASSPIRTTTRCSSTCARRRARRTTTWRSGRSRSATSSSRTRTSTRSSPASAAARAAAARTTAASWCS